MPTPDPPRTAAEKFSTVIRWLTGVVAARSGGDQLSYLLIGYITERLRRINQCFKRIVARLGAGTYAPRRFAPHRPPADKRPREPSKLPNTFGWLLPLVPQAIGYRAQLEHLLRDPEFCALLAAAPATLGRPLRSLCWMLRLSPPDILAPPKRPRPPKQPPPAAKTPKTPDAPKTPPRRLVEGPEWLRTMPSSIRLPKNWV